ncbi:MAG: hypothetical protein R2745_03765 [Vicinamibacterales bacterium]
MSKAVLHRLPDGRWRVTDAPGGWVNDGRDYPPPSDSDRVYEFQADAIRDYLERTTPRDPEDEIAAPGES